jgi:hypothetical protein
MSDTSWVVEVKGPNGVRQIELTDEAVKGYVGTNAYASAAWLAGWAIQKDSTDD